MLADTPEIPIRSVAMGLVEIHGKAKGPQAVLSPVTKTPCFFYKVDIERWIRDKNGGHWSHAATDAEGVRFYLEDATGKVLVDAHGAWQPAPRFPNPTCSVTCNQRFPLLTPLSLLTGGVFSQAWDEALWIWGWVQKAVIA